MTGETLKILSYNIHKGFGSGMNSRFTLHAMRQAIRGVHPDLVFLQEVLGHHEGHRRRIENWPDQSQFEFLADSIWSHYAYGKNAVYDAGHHGNAILSKFPFTGWDNIDISTNRVERRGLLHGVIGIPGRERPVHAICIHLGLLEGERMRQLELLCDRIESHVPHSDPLIIAGDFNDWLVRISKLLRDRLDVREAFLEKTGVHARTFPSWLPALRLDRVYVRGAQIQNAICMGGAPWNELSDHSALFVELELE